MNCRFRFHSSPVQITQNGARGSALPTTQVSRPIVVAISAGKKGNSNKCASQGIDHDDLPGLAGKLRRVCLASFPRHGFGRCDGRHKLVDLKLEKTPLRARASREGLAAV